jgi:hypothetical protein
LIGTHFERRRFIYPPERRLLCVGNDKALGDETVVNLPAIHSLDELAELDMRETPGKRFGDQVDNYSQLSIYKIRGENCANRSHGPEIAPVVLRDN